MHHYPGRNSYPVPSRPPTYPAGTVPGIPGSTRVVLLLVPRSAGVRHAAYPGHGTRWVPEGSPPVGIPSVRERGKS
eukprot:2538820-Rhodomonas_salina.2